MSILLGRILASRDGHRWPVVVIEGGRDLNGRSYSPAALRQLASMAPPKVVVNAFAKVGADGAVTFDHLANDDLVGRCPLNQVGFIEGIRYDDASGKVLGELVVLDAGDAADVQRHLAALEKAGGLDTVGLSIDSSAVVEPSGRIVEFLELYSVDIVTHPAAGGRIGHRIAASRRRTATGERNMGWFERLKARCPQLCEGLTSADKVRTIASKMAERLKDPQRVTAMAGEEATTLGFLLQDLASVEQMDKNELIAKLENVIGFLKSQDAAAGGEPEAGEGGGEPMAVAASRGNGAHRGELVDFAAAKARMQQQQGELETAVRTAKLELSRGWLERACASRKLPEAATKRLLAQHKERVLASYDEADGLAKAEQEYVDGFVEASAGARVQIVRESVDNAKDMLSHMLAPNHIAKPKCGLEDIGYSLHRFNKRMFGLDPSDLAHGQEGRRRIRAAVDATNFDQVYADALRRAMLADYNGDPRLSIWRNIVRIVPLQDFRTHRVIKVGWYGYLGAVGERDPYPTLTTPTDSEETIALSKKGGIESISWESMLNDDLTLWQTTLQRLGRAALETIFDAVFQQVRVATMPTLSDGKKLYDSTRTDANAGTLPLTADATGKTNFINTVTAMMQRTGGSGQKKGVMPAYIIIPFAKTEAWAYVWNALTGGNTGTDVNVALKNVLGFGMPEALIDWGTSNTTDWVLMAKPSDAEVLRVAFLGGREEPELIISDDDKFSAMFARDVTELKIRHVYGIAATDYVGIYGQDSAT